jgi:hypothetical protein
MLIQTIWEDKTVTEPLWIFIYEYFRCSSIDHGTTWQDGTFPDSYKIENSGGQSASCIRCISAWIFKRSGMRRRCADEVRRVKRGKTIKIAAHHHNREDLKCVGCDDMWFLRLVISPSAYPVASPLSFIFYQFFNYGVIPMTEISTPSPPTPFLALTFCNFAQVPTRNNTHFSGRMSAG